MTAKKASPDALAAFKKRLLDNPPVFAQKLTDTSEERDQGILVGNYKGVHLVVGGFEQDRFGIGERIILRMILGSEVVGFETEVTAKTERPLMYVVKFPDAVEAIHLRHADRVQAFFPAEVRVSQSGSEAGDTYLLKTRILDISSGGCCFRSKTKIPPDAEVKISFMLPGERQIQSASAVVLESVPLGKVYNNRAKFPQDGANIPIVQEISNWVNDSLSFAGDSL
ncbi:MAG: PilZ domain-containing protein [bacterium]